MFKTTQDKLVGAGIASGAIGLFIILIVNLADMSGDDYNSGLAGFGGILIAIGVILFIIGMCTGNSNNSSAVPESTSPTPRKLFYEKTEAFYEQKLKELGFSKNSFDSYCYPVDGGLYYYGISNGAFFQIETDCDHYHSRYGYPLLRLDERLTFTDIETLAPIELEYIKIPIDKIQYYAKEGDVQYTTQISGGGGGGSSLLGAVVGGAIAGEAGAIIGSRKKTTPITTTTNTHDTRKTILRYYEGDALKVLSYRGTDMYDFLLKNVPEKDLLSVQLATQKTPKSESTKEKLIELKSLYEEGLIDESEYNEKRSEILKKI